MLLNNSNLGKKYLIEKFSAGKKIYGRSICAFNKTC